jgi:hypothetical protein
VACAQVADDALFDIVNAASEIASEVTCRACLPCNPDPTQTGKTFMQIQHDATRSSSAHAWLFGAWAESIATASTQIESVIGSLLPRRQRRPDADRIEKSTPSPMSKARFRSMA